MQPPNALVLTALVGCIYLSVLPPVTSAPILTDASILAHDVVQPNLQALASAPLQKRGAVSDFFTPGAASKAHREMMLDKYKSKVERDRGLALELSDNGRIDRTTPLMNSNELDEILYKHANGPKVYAQERARAKYVKNLAKVDMLEKSDSSAMMAEAAKKYKEGSNAFFKASMIRIASENSALKGKEWNRKASGKEDRSMNRGPFGKPLIRTEEEYRNQFRDRRQELDSQSAEVASGDLTALDHDDKYKKNVLRATALVTKDKRLAREIATRYVAKSAHRKHLSEQIFIASTKQYQKADDWLALAKGTERQKKADAKRLSKSETISNDAEASSSNSNKSDGAATRLSKRDKMDDSMTFVKVRDLDRLPKERAAAHPEERAVEEADVLPLVKRAVYKPDWQVFHQKKAVYSQEAHAAAKKLDVESVNSNSAADEGKNRDVLFKDTNGMDKFLAQHFQRKYDNNYRKYRATRTLEGARAEAQRYQSLKEKHTDKKHNLDKEVKRLSLRKQVWTNEADGNSHLNQALMKQPRTEPLVHSEAKYQRKLEFHTGELREIQAKQREQGTEDIDDPVALKHANRKHKDTLKVAALKSGDKAIARSLAQQYSGRIAIHRDMLAEAKKKSDLYGVKEKGWNRIADEKNKDIKESLKWREEKEASKKRKDDKILKKLLKQSQSTPGQSNPNPVQIQRSQSHSSSSPEEGQTTPAQLPSTPEQVQANIDSTTGRFTDAAKGKQVVEEPPSNTLTQKRAELPSESLSIAKRGIYEKPTTTKYEHKLVRTRAQAITAADAVKGEAFQSAPDADEATRRRVIHEKPNGPLLFKADRLARKVENNDRKYLLALYDDVPAVRAEAQRNVDRHAEQFHLENKHLVKAFRSKVLGKVWENEAADHGHENDAFLKKQIGFNKYNHEAGHYERKAASHGVKYNAYTEEQRNTDPEAINHGEKKRWNELRATALSTQDKKLAQEVARGYKVKTTIHQDLADQAKVMQAQYSRKARDWNGLADQEEKKIALTEQKMVKEAAKQARSREALEKKKQKQVKSTKDQQVTREQTVMPANWHLTKGFERPEFPFEDHLNKRALTESEPVAKKSKYPIDKKLFRIGRRTVKLRVQKMELRTPWKEIFSIAIKGMVPKKTVKSREKSGVEDSEKRQQLQRKTSDQEIKYQRIGTADMNDASRPRPSFQTSPSSKLPKKFIWGPLLPRNRGQYPDGGASTRLIEHSEKEEDQILQRLKEHDKTWGMRHPERRERIKLGLPDSLSD